MQWTVDDLDSGGGLMTNKNKSLASESDGDVFVGTIPSWVTQALSIGRIFESNLWANGTFPATQNTPNQGHSCTYHP